MSLSFGWLPGLMPATESQATAPCNAGSCRRHAVGQRLRSALEKSEKILCGGAPVPCPCLPTRTAMAGDSGKPEAPNKHDGWPALVTAEDACRISRSLKRERRRLSNR